MDLFICSIHHHTITEKHISLLEHAYSNYDSSAVESIPCNVSSFEVLGVEYAECQNILVLIHILKLLFSSNTKIGIVDNKFLKSNSTFYLNLETSFFFFFVGNSVTILVRLLLPSCSSLVPRILSLLAATETVKEILNGLSG